MRVKTCPAKLKTGSDTGNSNGLKEGEFEAIVSAFGNVDAVGDIVEPGAFAKSLEAWGESGDPIPVIWSHEHNNPDAHIGTVLDSKEVEQGLWVKGQLDLDEPFAAKVYRLLKGRRVTKFSFAYDIKDYKENDNGGYDLKELDLWEVGPTLIPANEQTALLDIKSRLERSGLDPREFLDLVSQLKGIDFKSLAADLSSLRNSGSKAGRVLSAKNENVLREIHNGLSGHLDQLKSVLAAVEDEADSDEPKADPADSATGTEPTEGKGDNPSDDPKSATPPEPTPRSDAALLKMLEVEALLADID